jgi:hypothetical protein
MSCKKIISLRPTKCRFLRVSLSKIVSPAAIADLSADFLSLNVANLI